MPFAKSHVPVGMRIASRTQNRLFSAKPTRDQGPTGEYFAALSDTMTELEQKIRDKSTSTE